MALKGVGLLPVTLTSEEALTVYKKLSKVTYKVGVFKAALEHTLLNQSVLGIFAFNESVQSTRIEGTQVTFHEIMESMGQKNKSWEQQEVLNYKKALDYGVHEITDGKPVSSRLIKALHQILMENARGTVSGAGEFRKIQNFIGPDGNIENANYIPVAANEIDLYMSNLEHFINGMNHQSFRQEGSSDDILLSYNEEPLLRIAIAHAQFESIHPFLDGNGRLGRILIALMALQEKLITFPLFFVSEELEKERIRYYNALNATRLENPDWFTWIMFFLEATERMSERMVNKLKNVEAIAGRGLKACASDAQKNIWLLTFQLPIATTKQLSEISNYQQTTTRNILNSLVNLNLIDRDDTVKRNKKYYNYDVLRELQS